MALDYKGKIRLKIGTKTVMHEVTASFTYANEFDEIASKDIDGKDYNPKNGDWSISVDAIADNTTESAQFDMKAVADAAVAKSLLSLELTDDVNGNMNITGSGWVENFNPGFNNNEITKFSFSIKGKGLPTFGTVAS